MSTPGIDQLLNELRSASALAAGKSPAAESQGTPPVDFADVLKSAVDGVNSAQQTAQDSQKHYEEGAQGVNLEDVVVQLQKASLSFQTMVQVRNKLVTAYQDIMNPQG